jgi:tetratricopeptide (TPR) repeat protein
MRFKRAPQGTREIAAALRVGSILEGSVRRAGDRRRVVVQLIDVGTDSHVWSETYDRELDDVFAIQTEIALSVTSALSATLTAGEEARIRRRTTRSLRTHDLYYLGRHHWWSFSDDGLLSAKDNFERAIELDPLYAPAHSGLALTYLVAGRGGAALFSMAEAMPKAKAAAQKAISIDPGLGDADRTLAMVHAWFEWDWLKAEKVGREGVRVEPNSSIAWGGLAYALEHVGRAEEAVQASERFLGLDPLAALANHNHGLHLFHARRAEEARSYAQRATELDPSFPFGRTLLLISPCGRVTLRRLLPSSSPRSKPPSARAT